MSIATKARPRAHVVVLEGTFSANTIVGEFTLTSAHSDLPQQLHDLANGIRSHIDGLKPARVVVRRADQPPRASNAEGPKVRLLSEGALIAAATDRLEDVTVCNGKELGAASGMSKAGLDAHATSHVAANTEAAAAALVGLL